MENETGNKPMDATGLINNIRFYSPLHLPNKETPSLKLKLYSADSEEEPLLKKTIEQYPQVLKELFKREDIKAGAGYGFSILSQRGLMVVVYDAISPSVMEIMEYSWLLDLGNLEEMDIKRINSLNRDEMEIMAFESNLWYAHLNFGEKLQEAKYLNKPFRRLFTSKTIKDTKDSFLKS